MNTIRIAQIDDMQEMEMLMKRSMQILGEGLYSPAQISSICKYVCVPDQQIIEDGTYYVVESADKSMVGCGGWSFRSTLYAGPTPKDNADNRLNPATDPARIRAMFVDPEISRQGIGTQIIDASEKAARHHGFTRGALGSTLPGYQFYLRKGWQEVSRENAELPDGVYIEVVQMVKTL